MLVKTLYYRLVEGTFAKAMLVLDEKGTLYYASLGEDSNALRETLVTDFASKQRQFQLKPMVTLSNHERADYTALCFLKLMEEEEDWKNEGEESLQQKGAKRIPIEFIFGTELQRKVWQQLLEIPVGEVRYYGNIVEALGLPKNASRAVGNACGANKIALVVPCHRVIAQTGKLTGYRWGLATKKQILKMELGDAYTTLVSE